MTGRGPSRRKIAAWFVLSIPFGLFLLFGIGEPDIIHLVQATAVLAGAILGRRFPLPAGAALLLLGLAHAVLFRASIYGLTLFALPMAVGGVLLLTCLRD